MQTLLATQVLSASPVQAAEGARIAVVIPCHRVADHIRGVISRIGREVWRIYVVDDCCPQKTGDLVEATVTDPRVRVIRNKVNLGVGGAVLAGYRAALTDGAKVFVKIDGDGQMDPALIPRFVAPILEGRADYTKGNRFFNLSSLVEMPRVRLLGNAVLSFMSKVSTGYWTVFDPTNGYTAIDARVASWLPFDALSKRYFFETDILFRLNTLRAVVVDIPMEAVYGDEQSGLKISKIIGEFCAKHVRNTMKRIFYNYVLRDMSVASLELLLGIMLVGFGILWGGVHWVRALEVGTATPLGTIMLAILPLLIGTQLLLGFVAYDIASVPQNPCASRLGVREPSSVKSRVGDEHGHMLVSDEVQ